MLKIKSRPDGLAQKAFSSTQPFITPVAHGHPMLAKFPSVQSIISIPLIHKDRLLGILTVLSSKDAKELNNLTQSLNLFSLISSLSMMRSKQNERLRSALEKRDLFISLASHELKTPLTVVKSFAQIIHRKIIKGDALKSEWTESLLRESDHLSDLIEELMQVNKIRKGQLDYEFGEVSLKELIKKAIKDIKFSYPSAQVSFRNIVKKDQDKVNGDYLKLYEVISNLLNNAVKYSQPKAIVEITLSTLKEYLAISIKDNGCGITKADIPNIFKDFYRGKNSKKGMGLGLYLSKKIIEKHKGLIKVKSQPGLGSTFKVLIPATTRDKKS